jgi:hypothetical protein
VTFLLFLASLAVMEYLVRKPRKKPGDNPKGADRRDATAGSPTPAATSTPSLLALGRALEAQGRGKAPDRERAPQVHGPPVDGV